MELKTNHCSICVEFVDHRMFSNTKEHEGGLMLKAVGMMCISFGHGVKEVQQGQVVRSWHLLGQVGRVHQNGLSWLQLIHPDHIVYSNNLII